MVPIDVPIDLTESERDFLDAVRSGETARGYARRLHYSDPWAEWVSKKVRAKLGVATIGEAVAMSELAGFQAQIDALGRKMEEAIGKLAEAVTPKETAAATSTIRDLKDELRSRGLTEKDLDAAAERKRDEVIDARVDARIAERERLAAEKAAEDADADEGAGDKTLGDKIKDGLGGVRNVRPT